MSEVRPGHVLRVVSYNVRAFKDDTDALVDLVRTMDPDVLLVQEAPRHPFAGHRIARFAQQCGLTWSDGKRGWMSTTLLTSLRVHLHDCVHRNLVVRKGDEPRGYALATVSLPGHRPVHVASLHMSLRGADRKAHIPIILDALDPQHQPVVFGGDLNETPGHDLWNEFGKAVPEVTQDAFTFPSSGPKKRIDAIFASKELAATTPEIAWNPADLPAATDHLPVVVDLDLSAIAR